MSHSTNTSYLGSVGRSSKNRTCVYTMSKCRSTIDAMDLQCVYYISTIVRDILPSPSGHAPLRHEIFWWASRDLNSDKAIMSRP